MLTRHILSGSECWFLLPLVALVASQECRGVGVRSSPRPGGVWGERNAAPHGFPPWYVRARRTRPGGSLSVGVLVGKLPRRRWSGNKVHANRVVRMAGAKLVGGPAWRVLGVGSRGPRVGCALAHTLHGLSLHEFIIRYSRRTWTLDGSLSQRWIQVRPRGELSQWGQCQRWWKKKCHGCPALHFLLDF